MTQSEGTSDGPVRSTNMARTAVAKAKFSPKVHPLVLRNLTHVGGVLPEDIPIPKFVKNANIRGSTLVLWGRTGLFFSRFSF